MVRIESLAQVAFLLALSFGLFCSTSNGYAQDFIVNGLDLPMFDPEIDGDTTSTTFNITWNGLQTAKVVEPYPYFTGPNASEFALKYYSAGFPPGMRTSNAIRVVPSSYGSKSATLIIPNDQTSGPLEIPVTAIVGTQHLSLSTTYLGFNSISIYDEESTRSLTISNVGIRDLAFTGAGLVFSANTAFSFVDPVSTAPLAPGATREYIIRFDPATQGSFSHNLTVTTDDPFTPVKLVSLNGFAGIPQCHVQTSGLDFGQKVINEPVSDPALFRVTSAGQVPMRFVSPGIYLSGGDADSFRILKPIDLSSFSQRYEFRDFKVLFAPTSVGSKSTTLTVLTNDPTRPAINLLLKGMAVAPSGTTHVGRYTGIGPGKSTIGLGGDYPTLSEACKDTSLSLTGGNWEFEIISDLNEINNSFLAVPSTNGNIIRFRPAMGTSATVTFLADKQNIGNTYKFNGHFVIGVTKDTAGRFHRKPTSNIIINGSSIPNGTERNLLFRTLSPPIGRAGLINILGDCRNTTITNCQLTLEGPGSGSAPVPAAITYGVFSYNAVSDSTELGGVPSFGTVSNCKIYVTPSSQRICSGIYVENIHRGTFVAAPVNYISNPSNMMFINNEIDVLGVGVYTGSTTGSLIAGNRISVQVPQPTLAQQLGGIQYSSRTNGYQIQPFPASCIITSNSISVARSAESKVAFSGIDVDNTDQTGEFLVANNSITGITRSEWAGLSTPWQRSGISFSTNVDTTGVIAHNSIHMKESPNPPALMDVCGIGTSSKSPSGYSYFNREMKGTMIVRNNIIRMDETSGSALLRHSMDGTFKSDYNDLSTTDVAYVVHWYGYLQPGLTDYQTTSGQDLNSIQQNPFEPGGANLGHWMADNNDLRFSSFPGSVYYAPALSFVKTDMDGDLRGTHQTLMGSDEVLATTSTIELWRHYE